MLDEVAFIITELFIPILDITGQIDLFRCPETRFRPFLPIPYIMVFDRKQNKPCGVLIKNGLHVLHNRSVYQDRGQDRTKDTFTYSGLQSLVFLDMFPVSSMDDSSQVDQI